MQDFMFRAGPHAPRDSSRRASGRGKVSSLDCEIGMCQSKPQEPALVCCRDASVCSTVKLSGSC